MRIANFSCAASAMVPDRTTALSRLETLTLILAPFSPGARANKSEILEPSVPDAATTTGLIGEEGTDETTAPVSCLQPAQHVPIIRPTAIAARKETFTQLPAPSPTTKSYRRKPICTFDYKSRLLVPTVRSLRCRYPSSQTTGTEKSNNLTVPVVIDIRIRVVAPMRPVIRWATG